MIPVGVLQVSSPSSETPSSPTTQTILTPSASTAAPENTQAAMAKPSQEGVAPSTTAPTGSAPEDVEPLAPVTGCLTATGVVDCTLPHSREIIPVGASACTPDALRELTHAGAEDVLRPDIRVVMDDSLSVCVAHLPSEDWTGSLAQGFEGEDDGRLRHCLDDEGGPVRCDVPHRGEVLAHAVSISDCPGMVASAMGTPTSAFPSVLSRQVREGDPHECVVEVKGENVLVRSLHGLGRRTVPVEPAS